MVRSDEVDIISICVKVPEHRDILLAALAAGKHIYCEWPLGRNIQEAEELASTAERAGVHVTIGLQARLSPAARRARQLVQDGAIGRPLSARILSTSPVTGFAHFIFSGKPSDREFWLGKKLGMDQDAIEQKYRCLKACLHGCDAHRLERVAVPDLDRYCWIKGDLSFE